MASASETVLFAARRSKNPDGTSVIHLVVPSTGKRLPAVDESVLRTADDCKLGCFLSWIGDKVTKKNYLTSSVVEDVAYVDNIRAKLLNIEGVAIFQSNLFSHAICRYALPPGDYEVKINLLLTEYKLPSGNIIQFEATNPRPVRDNQQYPSSFIPRPSHFVPCPTGPIAPGGPSTSASPIPSGSSNATSRASTPSGKEPIVKGAGFQPKPKAKNFQKQSNKKVVGTGFEVKKDENQKNNVVVGTGFAVPEKKENQVVVGAGFEVKTPKTLKLKAVVLSMTENKKNGVNTHFLWILDRQAEGRFVSKQYKLEQGHFFEGIFMENTSGKWNCEKYEKPIEKPAGIDGGLDFDRKIWFTVTANKFQPAGGNRRFGTVKTKYFGEVVDGELESMKLSAASNGKQIKIQRKGIAEKDYVWMVIQIL